MSHTKFLHRVCVDPEGLDLEGQTLIDRLRSVSVEHSIRNPQRQRGVRPIPPVFLEKPPIRLRQLVYPHEPTNCALHIYTDERYFALEITHVERGYVNKIMYQARCIYAAHRGAWPDDMHVAMFADEQAKGVVMAAALTSMTLAKDDEHLKSMNIVAYDGQEVLSPKAVTPYFATGNFSLVLRVLSDKLAYEVDRAPVPSIATSPVDETWDEVYNSLSEHFTMTDRPGEPVPDRAGDGLSNC